MEIAMRKDCTLREEYLMKIWDNYILNDLLKTVPCKMAIYDLRARRLIVNSDRFYVTDNELFNILEGMKYPDVLFRDGVTIQNRHYEVRRTDGKNGIYAKDGEDGCTVCLSVSMLVVSVNDHHVKSEVCNEHVMKLGDYFRSLGI
ncbi:hypothetical protein ACF0H5_004985 [Mactra antiquata]